MFNYFYFSIGFTAVLFTILLSLVILLMTRKSSSGPAGPAGPAGTAGPGGSTVDKKLIKNNTASISENTKGITSNLSSISENTGSISENTKEIYTNQSLIGKNTGSISKNTGSISENTTNVDKLTKEMSSLKEIVNRLNKGVATAVYRDCGVIPPKANTTAQEKYNLCTKGINYKIMKDLLIPNHIELNSLEEQTVEKRGNYGISGCAESYTEAHQFNLWQKNLNNVNVFSPLDKNADVTQLSSIHGLDSNQAWIPGGYFYNCSNPSYYAKNATDYSYMTLRHKKKKKPK